MSRGLGVGFGVDLRMGGGALCKATAAGEAGVAKHACSWLLQLPPPGTRPDAAHPAPPSQPASALEGQRCIPGHATVHLLGRVGGWVETCEWLWGLGPHGQAVAHAGTPHRASTAGLLPLMRPKAGPSATGPPVRARHRQLGASWPCHLAGPALCQLSSPPAPRGAPLPWRRRPRTSRSCPPPCRSGPGWVRECSTESECSTARCASQPWIAVLHLIVWQFDSADPHPTAHTTRCYPQPP